MSRLFEALELAKDRLPKELSEFVEKLEEIEQEVDYMDVQDYEAWKENPEKDGLEAYISEILSDYLLKIEKEDDYALSKAEATEIARDILDMDLIPNNPVFHSGYYLLSRTKCDDIFIEAFAAFTLEEDEGRLYFSINNYAERSGGDNIVQLEYEYTEGHTCEELANVLYKLATKTYSRENLVKMNENYLKECNEIER